MKQSVTKFDFESAFKALDEVKMPEMKTTSRVKANRGLNEAVRRTPNTEALLEEYYDVNDQEDLEGAQAEREEEVAKAKLARIEKIVDLDAQSADELLPSYVGKVIIQCPQCMTLFYKNVEDLEPSEDDENIVNVSETCQHCGNTSGYTVIGKVEGITEEEADNYEAAEEANAEEPEEETALPDAEEMADEESTDETAEESEEELPATDEAEESDEDEEKKEESLQTSGTILTEDTAKPESDFVKLIADSSDDTPLEEAFDGVTDAEWDELIHSDEFKTPIHEEADGENLEEGVADWINGLKNKAANAGKAIKNAHTAIKQGIKDQVTTKETKMINSDLSKDGYFVLGVNRNYAEIDQAAANQDKQEKDFYIEFAQDKLEDALNFAKAKSTSDKATLKNVYVGLLGAFKSAPGTIYSSSLVNNSADNLVSNKARLAVLPDTDSAIANSNVILAVYLEGKEIANNIQKLIDAQRADDKEVEKSVEAGEDAQAIADRNAKHSGALETILPEDSPVSAKPAVELKDLTIDNMKAKAIEASKKLAALGGSITLTLDTKEVFKFKDGKAIATESLEANSSFEDIEEESLNKCITESLINVYENVKSFNTTSCDLVGGKFIVEGVITFTSGKTKASRYTFTESTVAENKATFNGLNESLANDGTFCLDCTIDNKKLMPESFSYKYSINENLVEGKTLAK